MTMHDPHHHTSPLQCIITTHHHSSQQLITISSHHHYHVSSQLTTINILSPYITTFFSSHPPPYGKNPRNNEHCNDRTNTMINLKVRQEINLLSFVFMMWVPIPPPSSLLVVMYNSRGTRRQEIVMEVVI